jgi:hypothetical protein
MARPCLRQPASHCERRLSLATGDNDRWPVFTCNLPIEVGMAALRRLRV